MNESFKFHILLLLAFLFAARSNGELSTCVMVNKEGSAPAVLQSPKCPRWTLSNYVSIITTTTSSTAPCQLAILQGRRKFQEDRIPFPGLSLSLCVFVVNCINTILFSIYCRDSPEYFHFVSFSANFGFLLRIFNCYSFF